jgi:very-short-patch-repair endonuclease
MRGYDSTTLERARSLRRSATDAELRMWRLLRNRRLLPFKFRRQHPIGRYVADFACIEKHLVVELDGAQHALQRGYDERRSAELAKRGYTVVRFADNDVLLRPEAVLAKIYLELGLPSP